MEELGFGIKVRFSFVGSDIAGEKIGDSRGVDRETVEDFFVERFGGGSDDGIGDLSFPGVVEEFVENGSFDTGIGGENGSRLAGGTKNLVNEVGDCDFAGGASDADKT